MYVAEKGADLQWADIHSIGVSVSMSVSVSVRGVSNHIAVSF